MPRTAADPPEVDLRKLELAVRAVMNCGDPGPGGRRVPIRQTQVAVEAKVADGDVSNLLSGAGAPSLKAQINLMAWLNMSPALFMRDPAPEPAAETPAA